MRFFVSCAWLTLGAILGVGVHPAEAVRNLSLVQAERLLFERNREILLARRALEGAQADTLTAAQRPNPTLSFNASSINPSQGIGAGRPWDKQIDQIMRIDQTFERGGKRDLRMQASGLSAEAAKWDLADVRRRQLLLLRGAYHDLLLAQERERISAEISELYRRTMDALTLRLKAGDIASAEVARVHVDALRAENDLRQAQSDRERAQSTLGYILAEPPENVPELRATDMWPQALAQRIPPDYQKLIENRADVTAASKRAQAAQKTRDLALAMRTRDVTIGAQYERFPPDASNTFGVGVSVPLFIGYHFEGEIRRTQSDYLATQDTLRQVRAQAITEIAQAQSSLDGAAARLKRFDEQLLREARRAAEAVEFAFRRGATGATELLDARRTLRSTLLDAASTHADYAKALAAMQAAQGDTGAQP